MSEFEKKAASALDAAIREYVSTVSVEEVDQPGPVTHWALVTGFLPDSEQQGTPHWVVAPGGQQDFITSGLLHVALHPSEAVRDD